jgi:hypothetical protein
MLPLLARDCDATCPSNSQHSAVAPPLGCVDAYADLFLLEHLEQGLLVVINQLRRIKVGRFGLKDGRIEHVWRDIRRLPSLRSRPDFARGRDDGGAPRRSDLRTGGRLQPNFVDPLTKQRHRKAFAVTGGDGLFLMA